MKNLAMKTLNMKIWIQKAQNLTSFFEVKVKGLNGEVCDLGGQALKVTEAENARRFAEAYLAKGLAEAKVEKSKEARRISNWSKRYAFWSIILH